MMALGESLVSRSLGLRLAPFRALAALSAVLCMTFGALPAWAQETVNYNYDALGRVATINHSGSVNNGVQQTYAHDAADNRTNVTVTGAASAAKVIVVPLNGLTVIPIPAQ